MICMKHGNPIYTFESKSQSRFLTIICMVFVFSGSFLFLYFLISQLMNDTCMLNDRPVPCRSFYSPYILAGMHLLFGLGGTYLGRKRTEIITCYHDGIESSTRGFLNRDCLVSIDLFRLIGSRTRGSVLIKTKFPVNLPMRSPTNTFVISNLEDAESAYQKIKLCYGLAYEDLVRIPTVTKPFNKYNSLRQTKIKESTDTIANRRTKAIGMLLLLFLGLFCVMIGIMIYFINSAFRP